MTIRYFVCILTVVIFTISCLFCSHTMILEDETIAALSIDFTEIANEIENVPNPIFSELDAIKIEQLINSNMCLWQDIPLLIESISQSIDMINRGIDVNGAEFLQLFDIPENKIKSTLQKISSVLENSPSLLTDPVYVRENFRIFKVSEVRLTKYYIPLIENASFEIDESHMYPVFSVPDDYIYFPGSGSSRYFDYQSGMFSSYMTKQDIIDRNILQQTNRSEILAALSSREDLETLMLQGTGLIIFEDGTELMLGYANNNGHSWQHGAALVEQERYIFFSPTNKPKGISGIPISERFSFAADTQIYPFGLPGFILNQPDNDESDSITNLTLIKHDDTGSAFIGKPQKMDYFAGYGRDDLENAHNIFPLDYYDVYLIIAR